MAARRAKQLPARQAPADAILDGEGTTLLDVLDQLLNKGVVLNGDVVLGVAGVDLVYVRLSTLVCAIDRVMDEVPGLSAGGGLRKRRRNRGPSSLRKP